MADEPRPMPRVTIADPDRPGRAADLLVSGDERLPPDPAARRRRRRAGLALVLLGAAVLGGLELRDRRAAAERERRLAAVVDVRAEPQGGDTSYDEPSRTARLTREVMLHNHGARDLLVVGARAAGYELVQPEVRVPAGRQAQLLLSRDVACSATAPPASAADDLVLLVRTGSGDREAVVPLALDQSEPARACGFLPLEELFVSYQTAGRGDGYLDLNLQISTRAQQRVELVGAGAGAGLEVEPYVAGRPARLPLEVLAVQGLLRNLDVTLRLTVSDCTQALPTGRGPDLPPPDAPREPVTVDVRDATGRVGVRVVDYPPELLDSLVSEACRSGSRAS